MMDELVCWKCGAPLEELLLPIARTDHCKSCGADLHVCRLCKFYNPGQSDGCDEPLAAGSVTDATRSNFCDYLSPRENAFEAKDTTAAQQSQSELDALFGLSSKSGITPDNSDAALHDLKALFKDPDD
ncbi:MAG: hypothetical protein BMS9Abin26_0809 [Gammaproteobacteria bacterium]|nr:MAG: hypothetical protein BMS9Abin26_0809 [Gammaproteobacteria bacterium]